MTWLVLHIAKFILHANQSEEIVGSHSFVYITFLIPLFFNIIFKEISQDSNSHFLLRFKNDLICVSNSA